MKRTRWILGAILVAGFFLGGATATHGLFSAEMASWVQGTGTIGALAIAIYLAEHEARRNARLRLDRQISLLQLVCHTAKHANGYYEALAAEVLPATDMSRALLENIDEIEGIKSLLEADITSIPRHEIEDAQALREVGLINICCRALNGAVSRAIAAAKAGEPLQQDFRTDIESHRELMQIPERVEVILSEYRRRKLAQFH